MKKTIYVITDQAGNRSDREGIECGSYRVCVGDKDAHSVLKLADFEVKATQPFGETHFRRYHGDSSGRMAEAFVGTYGRRQAFVGHVGGDAVWPTGKWLAGCEDLLP